METVAERIGRYTMTTLDGPAAAGLSPDELRAVLNVRKPKKQARPSEPRAGDERVGRKEALAGSDGA